MYKSLLVLALIFCVVACKKKKDEYPVPCEFYTKGFVLAGIDDSATIEQVFNYSNSRHFVPYLINGFQYRAALQTDSAALITVLTSKSYLKDNTYFPIVFTDSASGRLYVRLTLLNMTAMNQQDFLRLRDSSALTVVPLQGRTMQIQVPEGQEGRWAAQLPDRQTITWANVMCWVF